MLRAVIFDFDGVVLDTETPLFDAWARTFEHYGAEPISHALWTAAMGRHEDDPEALDPILLLTETVGATVDPAAVQQLRRVFRDEVLDASPLRPGVLDLLDRAGQLGLSVAIASSSPQGWIERHLRPRNALDLFPTLVCAGDGVPGKPDPAVYLEAARQLGVAPADCLAIEDSPNGVAAAKAAGAICIAAPTPVSSSLDLRAADLVVDSIEDIDLDRWM